MSGCVAEQTTWSVQELRSHGDRLTRVSKAIDTTNTTARELSRNNGDAYGLLFGWVVGPALDLLCGSSADFGADLADAMAYSSDSITMAADNYEAVEDDCTEAIQQILRELESARDQIAGL